MCGIGGIHFRKPYEGNPELLEKFMDAMLDKLENRGRDSTGFCAVSMGGRYYIQKYPVRAALFAQARDPIPFVPRSLLCHTRFATQGNPVNPKNNHPVKYQNTILVHNGFITNDDKLFSSLKLKRFGEVDTEAAAATIAKHGFHRINDALAQLQGSFALGCVNPKKNPDTTLIIKGPGSPCEVFTNDDFVIFGSTKQAVDAGFIALTGIKEGVKYADIQTLEDNQLVWCEKEEVKGITWREKPTYDFSAENYGWQRNTSTRGYVASVEKATFTWSSIEYRQFAEKYQTDVWYYSHDTLKQIGKTGTMLVILNHALEEEKFKDKPCMCGHKFETHTKVTHGCLYQNCDCKAYARIDNELDVVVPYKDERITTDELRARLFGRATTTTTERVISDTLASRVTLSCEGCQTSKVFSDLKVYNGWRFCGDCGPLMNCEADDEIDFYPTDEAGKRLLYALQETAVHVKESMHFCQWLLFDSPAVVLDQEGVRQLRDNMTAAFLRADREYGDRKKGRVI